MRRLALLAPLLALSACGSHEVQVSAHDALAAQAVTTAPATASAKFAPPQATGGTDDLRLPTSGGLTTKPSEQKTLPKGRASHSNIPLKVTVASECVTPGGSMRATADTVKSAGLGFTAAYADNSHVPDFTFVPREGNPTGTFTWTWVVQPTIPPGDSLLTVVAYTDNEHSATFNLPFRVSRRC